VPNTKIESLKLEKVVSEDIHLDSQDEKAQVIIDLIQERQEKIDKVQSQHIANNTIEIEELKNGKKK